MSADTYLAGILQREAVDTSANSPLLAVQTTIAPIVRHWAGSQLVNISPSGSFAKGTANRSGTDIDLFISLASSTKETLEEIYESLFGKMTKAGYAPTRQNVSIKIHVGGYDVDLVPAKRQDIFSQDHSLFRRKFRNWQKTNVAQHITHVRAAGRQQETRILKLWRNQKGLDFPSFYLELAVIEGLRWKNSVLSQSVWTVFEYLRDHVENARMVDPANTNNIISDDLTAGEKTIVKRTAAAALSAKTWQEIVR